MPGSTSPKNVSLSQKRRHTSGLMLYALSASLTSRSPRQTLYMPCRTSRSTGALMSRCFATAVTIVFTSNESRTAMQFIMVRTFSPTSLATTLHQSPTTFLMKSCLERPERFSPVSIISTALQAICGLPPETLSKVWRLSLAVWPNRFTKNSEISCESSAPAPARIS